MKQEKTPKILQKLISGKAGYFFFIVGAGAIVLSIVFILFMFFSPKSFNGNHCIRLDESANTEWCKEDCYSGDLDHCVQPCIEHHDKKSCLLLCKSDWWKQSMEKEGYNWTLEQCIEYQNQWALE